MGFLSDDCWCMMHISPKVDQVPLPLPVSLALPRLRFKLPGPDAIATLFCSCPFSRISFTTSSSLWVPKSLSSCCCDGWRSMPWDPWLEKKTRNASYGKKKRWLWMTWVTKEKKLLVQSTTSVSGIVLNDHVKFKVFRKNEKHLLVWLKVHVSYD